MCRPGVGRQRARVLRPFSRQKRPALITGVMLILLTSSITKTTILINQKQSHEFWEDL